MSKITAANILRVFPEVLARSDAIRTLGEVMAEYLNGIAADAQKCALYINIDSLPEAVLDILAYDFKVDWYDTTYDVEVKREIIRNCIVVHRMQGTRAGCLYALKAIYSDAAITEWWEGNGRPYHYTVALPVDSTVEIDDEKVRAALKAFVPVRCVLQSDGIAYCRTEHLIVSYETGFVIYTTPVCGTIPYRSTLGGDGDSGLRFGLGSGSVIYTPKVCGSHKVI